MDIILYLTEILQTRKTVGIVGLGTLYKKKTPGKYDEGKHAFVPPSYSLTFTTEILEEEELANYIVFKRHISIDSAYYYIGEFAESVQQQLADQQEANLEPIGQLKLINNEVVLLTQETGFGYEFYGLPTVTDLNATTTAEPVEDLPPVDEEKLAEIEEENKFEEENPGHELEAPGSAEVEDDPFVDEVVAPTQNEKTWEIKSSSPLVVETIEREQPIFVFERPTSTASERKDKPKQGLPFFMKFLIIFLIIVVAGAIAYFINPDFFDRYIQNNFEGKTTQNIPVAPVDTLSTKVDSSKKDSVPQNKQLVTLVNEPTAIDSTKIYYEVIGTSYKTKKAADAYIKRIARTGIKATIADMPGKRFNVSLGTFTEASKAYKLKDSLKKAMFKNEDLYIQPIKPETHKK